MRRRPSGPGRNELAPAGRGAIIIGRKRGVDMADGPYANYFPLRDHVPTQNHEPIRIHSPADTGRSPRGRCARSLTDHVEPAYLSRCPSLGGHDGSPGEGAGSGSGRVSGHGRKGLGDLQEIIRKRPRLFAELIRELKEAPDEAVFESFGSCGTEIGKSPKRGASPQERPADFPVP